MATGHAIEIIEPQPQVGGEVIAFRAHWDRATKPRQSIDDRVLRAGYALAAELFASYEGTEASTETQVHAGTVIAIIATLAAEFGQAAATINRRATAPVSAGGWVLGGEADAILFAASPNAGVSTVWQMIASGSGLPDDELPDLARVVAHAEATVGEKPYPVWTVASPYRPKALLRAAAARHRQLAQALAADEGLCSPHEQALVCGAAIGHVIKADPRPAPLTLLAAEAMIGGARLEPLPYVVG